MRFYFYVQKSQKIMIFPHIKIVSANLHILFLLTKFLTENLQIAKSQSKKSGQYGVVPLYCPRLLRLHVAIQDFIS